MFRGDVGVVEVVWWVDSDGCGDAVACREVETRAGALALRRIDLVFVSGDGKEGGIESWRDFGALKGEPIEVELEADSHWERCVFGSFLFEGFVRERSEFSHVAGSENMEAFGWGDCVGFSSITRDFVNRKHSESRSVVDVEGE